MKYMEVSGSSCDSARCSDNACPCGYPGATIAWGQGYMFVSKDCAEFRKDCLSEAEARLKIQRMSSPMLPQGAIIMAGSSSVIHPILMCEQGAKKRGIDLEVAAADAKHWWKTGQVPLRPTPLAGAKEEPMRKSNRSSLLLLLATFLLAGLQIALILTGGPDWLGATAGLLSYALAAFTASHVARMRGYSRIWAVLGLLNFLGILIAFCFRDRTEAIKRAAAPTTSVAATTAQQSPSSLPAVLTGTPDQPSQAITSTARQRVVNWEALLDDMVIHPRERDYEDRWDASCTWRNTAPRDEMVSWLNKYGPAAMEVTPSRDCLKFRMPGVAKHDIEITRVATSEWQVYHDYVSD